MQKHLREHYTEWKSWNYFSFDLSFELFCVRYVNQDLKKKKKIYNMLIILSPFICTNDPVLYDVFIQTLNKHDITQ